jgi:hypothetical protein
MFADFSWTTALLIFIGYFFIDVGSTWTIIAVQKLQVGLATLLTFFLYLGSAVGIIEYTDNPVYALPMALGASLGGFAMLMWEKRKQEKSL